MKAFLGTGLLGSNWVRAMRKRNDEVQIWNRTESKAKALESIGAKAFSTPAEAVKGADRIHLAVSDDAAVDSVLEQALPGLAKDAIIIDHTTTSAIGAAERTSRWKSRSITYIHAPVFMGPTNALESTGSMLISGDQDVIKMIEPELSKMTGQLMNLGDDPSTAAGYKLLGNHLFMSITAGLADTFTLGKALGFPRDEVVEFIEQMGATPIKARVARILLGNYDAPSWELSMARKDARLMTEEAVRAGMALYVMPALGAHMDKLIAAGLGAKDWSIVTKEAVTEKQ
ncbi:MAG: NAD(P)-dependent oxidoreductase [Bacteroidota bacterium]|nr:NAD(P)-dependent oxidoreductase [Bacteroidota bacterium]